MQNLTAEPKLNPTASFTNLLQNNKILSGITLALLSNVLFAVLYLYSHWLLPLTGTQVFLWRMVAMWFGLLAIMLMSGSFAKLRRFWQGLTTLKQKLLLVLPTPILASQLWLFMWGPVNGQAVNVAIGYFLFPLAMVVAGYIVFGERLNRLKSIAIVLAVLGVVLQVYLADSVSWATAWVCLTYPIYYTVRRSQGVPALLGLFVDLTIIAPIALAVLCWQSDSFSVVGGSLSMVALVVGLGVISAVAMQSNLQASSLLPVNLFGMLSYLEPALMFVLSIVVLNEVVSVEKMLSFGLIWAGILVMIGQSVWQNKRLKK